MTVAIAVLAVAAAGSASVAAPSQPPRVTVIGDSVITAVYWYPNALAILDKGFSVDMEVGICRRLEDPSCTFEGVTPPSMLDLVHSLGAARIAPTVVVEMGYNDFASTFADDVDDCIRALLADGVKRILWLNLREARHPYVPMNAVLEHEAAVYPQVTIVDWNAYSRSHPEWFQNDGVHLFRNGGIAMATLVHAALVRALAPLALPDVRLPAATVGRRYDARLPTSGGTAPFRFRLAAGKLPRGLKLDAGGAIVGTPTHPARARVTIDATDAVGNTASRTALVVVAR